VGSLTLPADGPVYADAQVFIYSVECHPKYAPILRPLWESVASGRLEVVTSELTLLEALIGPLKKGDPVLEHDYELFFAGGGIRLFPITASVLREGARLRATLNSLRTPDAIHAATASSCHSTLVITNDFAFRQVRGLPVAILDDFLGP
jgi:predicted nucleic acid-binding protein